MNIRRVEVVERATARYENIIDSLVPTTHFPFVVSYLKAEASDDSAPGSLCLCQDKENADFIRDAIEFYLANR